ncbi:sigma-70 family RNA polymerase sigma factor [Luteolibacter sp. GHJ8]|uniref:Sigma-70 family RNA polymerase sigma factor n=1 Tax=Luteolibacter rhizosphaerae TaxID=2989719 RepID=A0ABT3G6P9_9BACT|nr:sigma-70 family RNA polymerase sigma factor [Luteolibacter rhizosphaerae]MCW1915164.1 sigma-70 family RNA polymerase sigma factor [Luteolibacter rhizosphaerae]
MDDLSDAELLVKWLEQRSEQAFALLVRRYAGLVYHAALRVGRDANLATEASQLTFITLARKAGTLACRDSLAGWLHVTGAMQARNLLQLAKRENRKRDELGQHLDAVNSEDNPQTIWKPLEPVLDEALAALSHADRHTILLRHYRSLSIREIATALSISVDAAQKRLDRAIERLRLQLTRRGCAPAAGLAAGLTHGLASNAEASLATANSLSASITTALRATPASSTFTLPALLMSKKPAIILATLALLIATSSFFLQTRHPALLTSQTAGPSPTTGNFQTTSSSIGSETQKTLDRLVATYGEDRTKRSRDLAGLVINRADVAHQLFTRFYQAYDSKIGLSSVPLRRSFELSAEQTTAADQVVRDFLQRQLAAEKQGLEEITRKPLPLVELLLASDACSRGALPENDYIAIRARLADKVRVIGDPIDKSGRSFSMGVSSAPQTDAAFISQFRALLTPEQLTAFNEDLKTFEEARARNPDDSTFATFDPTDLDLLIKETEATLKLIQGLSAAQEGGHDFLDDE